jgi:hypothetical protein
MKVDVLDNFEADESCVGIGKALILPTEMVCATHVSDNEMKTFV